jgi:glycosyltransferase involved in cell wall biosynthesis
LRQRAKTIIGYVGVMGPQDGVDCLLRALQHLAVDLERRDFFCVLIGDGDERASLQKLAARLGIDDFVWFTGRISDASTLVRYLSTADICVVPDPSNPYSDRSTMVKVMEYMAVGKPIVAFDLPEHRVTAQSAAVYVQPNDETKFAEALAALIDDPARRKRMGAFGRQRVNTQLAWCYSAPALLEVYRSLTAIVPDRVVGASARAIERGQR